MIYLVLAAALFLLDIGVKAYVDKHKEYNKPEEILGGRIVIQKIYNEGICLNMLDKNRNLMLALSGGCTLLVGVFYILLLCRKGYGGFKMAASLILGGALGNLYDRIRKKHVVDYFSFQVKWKRLRKVVFNLADMFIFAGSILAVVLTAFKKQS